MKQKLQFLAVGILTIFLFTPNALTTSKLSMNNVDKAKSAIDQNYNSVSNKCPYLESESLTACPYLNSIIKENTSRCPYLNGKSSCPYLYELLESNQCPYLNVRVNAEKCSRVIKNKSS